MKATCILLPMLLAAAPACDCEGPTPEDLAEMTSEASAVIVKRRELAAPPDGAFTQAVTSKEEVRSYLHERFHEVDAKQVLARAAMTLRDFGAIADDLDLAAAYEAAAVEQIAGYYDWRRKTLYIADWMGDLMQGPILIHEVTHAFQDHHFDLGQFMEPMPGYDDTQAAIAAVIEGDATLVMMDAMLGDAADDARVREMVMGQIGSQAADAIEAMDTPAIIAESLLFPYTSGIVLAEAARTRGGWARVNRLFGPELPLSTEQVMHPEKLLDTRDDPTDVQFATPDPLVRAGYSRLMTGVNGEFGFRFLFSRELLADDAARAAEGWDGDRYHLLERRSDGATLTVVGSVWDSAADARDAAKACRRTPRPPHIVLVDDTKVVGIWGKVTLDAATADAAARAVMSGMTLEPLTDIEQVRARVRDASPRDVR